ncbi:hypothetical protein V6N13_051942 [Hibiscus sabdariffa]
MKRQELQELSLFVENFPKGMQWKGLWHLFARHGDVIEAFIAGKLSRGEKRFGFVRFRCKTNAMRTMERMNGFSVYRFRLTVKLAYPKKRRQFLNQAGTNRGKSANQWDIRIVRHGWKYQVNWIEEIVEVNVGNMKYEISVVEIGFKDETCDPLLLKGKLNKNDHNGVPTKENQSESSSDTRKNSLPLEDNLNCSIEEDALEVMNFGSKSKGNVERSTESSTKSVQSKPSDKMNRNWSKVVQNLSQMAELNRACVNPVEDEAINVVHIGKDHIEGCFLAALEINRQLAKVDILGVKPDKDCTCKAVENEKSCEGDISVLEQSNGQLGLTNCFDFNLAKDMIKSPREVVGKDLEVNTNGIQDSQLENMDPVTSQALEDIRCMGLQNMVGKTLSPLERTKDKSYWEKWVDRQNNAQVNLGDSFAYREMVGSLEESRGFFPDYAPKRRKGKRYGSLIGFQDKFLLEKERKKRNRTLRRVKKSKNDIEMSELSGRFLSDSDLMARWNAAVKEARNTLELGKRVGFQIEGDESEAVRELALLDWNQSV